MGIVEIIEIVLAIIGAAATIAAITPTKRDDEIVGFILKIVDLVGMNIGNARNKDT